eukprot:TRINITY_DN111158_c0_g1_i1.p1 TRINITY_DN111158_c0_g1~~TRINITY_DN111158_c0_g1_i1.p1  ORF type:complete len:389 (-),score=96.30 TRINITY_DN111158_c0_g1_i1:223-1350(-)
MQAAAAADSFILSLEFAAEQLLQHERIPLPLGAVPLISVCLMDLPPLCLAAQPGEVFWQDASGSDTPARISKHLVRFGGRGRAALFDYSRPQDAAPREALWIMALAQPPAKSAKAAAASSAAAVPGCGSSGSKSGRALVLASSCLDLAGDIAKAIKAGATSGGASSSAPYRRLAIDLASPQGRPCVATLECALRVSCVSEGGQGAIGAGAVREARPLIPAILQPASTPPRLTVPSVTMRTPEAKQQEKNGASFAPAMLFGPDRAAAGGGALGSGYWPGGSLPRHGVGQQLLSPDARGAAAAAAAELQVLPSPYSASDVDTHEEEESAAGAAPAAPPQHVPGGATAVAAAIAEDRSSLPLVAELTRELLQMPPEGS